MARLYVIAVTALFLVVGGHNLLFLEAGVPRHWPSAMRFTTKCVTPANTLTQSFPVTAAAVTGVKVMPVIASGTTGRVFFELRDGKTPAGAVRQRVEMSIADLTTQQSLTVKVAPTTTPADGHFTLWIGRSDDTGCLAFEASAESAPDAQLALGDREVLGDLLFQVRADRGTALDGYGQWLARASGIALPASAIGALAFVYAIAIAVLCWWLTVGGRRAATGTSARAAE